MSSPIPAPVTCHIFPKICRWPPPTAWNSDCARLALSGSLGSWIRLEFRPSYSVLYRGLQAPTGALARPRYRIHFEGFVYLLGSYAPHLDLGIDAKPQFNFDDLPSMMDSQERGGGVCFAHRIQSLCGCGGPVACGKLVTSLGPPVLGVVT